MLKRTVAGILWLLAFWSAWAVVSVAVVLPPVPGVLIGTAIGVFVAIDPFHRIWESTAAPSAQPAALEADAA
jgi:hypothetical protein